MNKIFVLYIACEAVMEQCYLIRAFSLFNKFPVLVVSVTRWDPYVGRDVLSITLEAYSKCLKSLPQPVMCSVSM